MSQPTFKAPRPVSEIQREYTSVCANAGQCQYQIATLTKDLDLINQTLRDLNAEAFASQEAAKKLAEEKAKEEAEKPKEEGKKPKEESKKTKEKSETPKESS